MTDILKFFSEGSNFLLTLLLSPVFIGLVWKMIEYFKLSAKDRFVTLSNTEGVLKIVQENVLDVMQKDMKNLSKKLDDTCEKWEATEKKLDFTSKELAKEQSKTRILELRQKKMTTWIKNQVKGQEFIENLNELSGYEDGDLLFSIELRESYQKQIKILENEIKTLRKIIIGLIVAFIVFVSIFLTALILTETNNKDNISLITNLVWNKNNIQF